MRIARAILPNRKDQIIGYQDYSAIFAEVQDTPDMYVQQIMIYARTVKVEGTGLQHAQDAGIAENGGTLEGNARLDWTTAGSADYRDIGL